MEHIFHNSLIDSGRLVNVAGRVESRQSSYYAELEPTTPGEYVYKTRPGTQLLLDFEPMSPTTSLELVVAINGEHYFAHTELKRGVILHPDMLRGTYPISFSWPKSGNAGLGTMVLHSTLRQFSFSSANVTHARCHIDFLFYKVKQKGQDARYRDNPQVYLKQHIFDYDSYLSIVTVLVPQVTR